MSEGRFPERLRDLLAGATPRFGIARPVETGQLWRRWPEVVGDSIAAHAEPSSLRDGVLRVRTDSPVWATEVGYLAEQIKGRANAIAGAEIVTEVRTWTAPGKVEQTTRPTAREPVVRATAEDPMEAFDGARRAWRKRRSTRP